MSPVNLPVISVYKCKAFSHLFIGIRDAFDRRREYQLGDSIKYFLDNLEKTNQVDYLPDQSDILHARKATKGIVESKIEIEGNTPPPPRHQGPTTTPSYRDARTHLKTLTVAKALHG